MTLVAKEYYMSASVDMKYYGWLRSICTLRVLTHIIAYILSSSPSVLWDCVLYLLFCFVLHVYVCVRAETVMND